MKNKFFLLFFIIIMFMQIISAKTVSEEYSEEFNLNGETCQIIDAFVYDISDPWIFYSSHKMRTVPVIYQCCFENESCTPIIFDVENKIFFNKKYTSEIIDINYIRHNLNNGNLSLNYFEVSGLDICDYFGMGNIKTESVNLASEVVSSGAVALGTEKAYQVAKTINTAKKVGIIGSFNPTNLVVGIACGYDDKKLKGALEILGQSNYYLSNINQGYSQEGYVKNLSAAMSLSKIYLDDYLRSLTAIARGGTNLIINFFKAIFDFSTQKKNTLEVDKIEYQVAQDVLKQLHSNEPLLQNPNNQRIVQENLDRITLNTQRVNEVYSLFVLEYNKYKEIVPSKISIFLTNLFFEPNYNISEGKDCFSNSKYYKILSEKLYSQNKFNSVISMISKANESLDCSKPILERESQVERGFDWEIAIILLLIILVFLILRNFDKFKKY